MSDTKKPDEKAAETKAPPQSVESEESVIAGFGLGRIVIYVPNKGDGLRAEEVVAIIVRAWDKHTGLANLQCFPDGFNHSDAESGRTVWVTSRPYSDDKTPGTWHYPPRA